MTITFLQPDGVAITAQGERQGSAAAHGGGAGRPLGGRSGFRVDTPSNILTATSTTWTLVPCSAEIDPGASTHQGMYGWATDANVTGSVAAADATYARKDIVYIQINDSSAGDGSGATTAPVVYVAGTPSASPVAPTLPARSFLVGTINMPVSGGGSPTVVVNPARYVAAGGILPVADATERDAVPDKFDGLTVRRMDLGARPLQWWDGTRWQANPNIIGYLSDASTSAGFSSGEWFVNQINNVAMIAGHKYEVEFKFNHVFPSAADVPFYVSFETSLTTDTGTTGTGFDVSTFWSAPVANSGKTDVARAVYVCTSDQTKRISVVTGRLSGTSLYDISGRVMTIKDLGYLA